MTASHENHWPGLGCTHPFWAYSPDPAVFEARRAVAQLSRSRLLANDVADINSRTVLDYIAAAHSLAASLNEVLQDLASQARVENYTWKQIGEAAGGVGLTAAEKRFGLAGRPHGQPGPQPRSAAEASAAAARLAAEAKPGERSAHLADLAAERLLGLTALQMIESQSPSDQEESVAERWAYVYRIIGTSTKQLLQVETEIAAHGLTQDLLVTWSKIQRNVFTIMEKLICDPAAWRQFASWGQRAVDIEPGFLHDPITYSQLFLYCFLQVNWAIEASMTQLRSLDEPVQAGAGETIQLNQERIIRALDYFNKARLAFYSAIQLNMRTDVRSALIPPILPFWDALEEDGSFEP